MQECHISTYPASNISFATPKHNRDKNENSCPMKHEHYRRQMLRFCFNLFKVYLTMLSGTQAVQRRVVECFGKDLEEEILV
jgi:hypothetical protein